MDKLTILMTVEQLHAAVRAVGDALDELKHRSTSQEVLMEIMQCHIDLMRASIEAHKLIETAVKGPIS